MAETDRLLGAGLNSCPIDVTGIEGDLMGLEILVGEAEGIGDEREELEKGKGFEGSC